MIGEQEWHARMRAEDPWPKMAVVNRTLEDPDSLIAKALHFGQNQKAAATKLHENTSLLASRDFSVLAERYKARP